MAEFSLDTLAGAARRFAEAILARHPAWAPWFGASADGIADGFDCTVPSPTGDPTRSLVLFMAPDPSVGWGQWHTHSDVWSASLPAARPEEAMLDLVDDILADRLVLMADEGGDFHGSEGLLDLRDRAAVLESLTNPHYAPPALRIRCWTGSLDRVIRSESDLPDVV